MAIRASHADREHVIGTLKTAFVQGRLTEDELDAWAAQVYASRTYAELAEVTADIPAALTGAKAPRDPWRAAKIAWRIEYAIFLPGIVTLILLPGGPRTSVAGVVGLTTVVAFVLAGVTLLVAPVITVGLMLDVRHQQRSGGQLPPGPTPAQAGDRVRRRWRPAGACWSRTPTASRPSTCSRPRSRRTG